MTHTLDELKRLCAEATAGPWTEPSGMGLMVFASKAGMHIADIRGWGHLTGKGSLNLPEDVAEGIQRANADFIAASRTALPELIAALEAANARAEALAGQVGEMRAGLNAPTLNVLLGLVEDGTDHTAWQQARMFMECRDDLLAQPPAPTEARVAAALALAEAYRDVWIRVDGDVPHASVRDECASYIQVLAEQAKGGGDV